MTGICQLCKEEKELIKSHIIPKFIHKKIDPNNKVAIIFEDETKNIVNDLGETELLFCKNCDSGIIGGYEEYFNAVWYRKNDAVAKRELKPNVKLSINVDHDKFLLFHLSVLYRISISTRSTFQNIHLSAQDNEKLRKIILSGIISDDRYQLYVKAASKDNKLYDRIIRKPYYHELDSHNFYSVVFAGCEWVLKISNSKYEPISNFIMNNGVLKIFVLNYDDFEPIQEIITVL